MLIEILLSYFSDFIVMKIGHTVAGYNLENSRGGTCTSRSVLLFRVTLGRKRLITGCRSRQIWRGSFKQR